jgi:uncharacterized DUF497 family protein
MALLPYPLQKRRMEVSFEWDRQKDTENQRKHGVSFTAAQAAFLDPGRVLASDSTHSGAEPRFYCFGRVADGILTVRFTHRGQIIRIIGAGYWRKGKRIYEARAQIHE